MNTSGAVAVSSNGPSDFVLSDGEYKRICELVREHTGIALSESKREMIYGRLVRRLRALRLSGFAPYIAQLEKSDTAELEEFINAVTTNLTSFFRESHHFDHLAKEVLPAMSRRAQGSGRLRIWSCACSTGEEPYSAAMVLREQKELLVGIDARILATDLDTQVLATASAGIYAQERLESVSQARVARYFQTLSDGVKGKVKVSPSLQELITFKQLNLMNDWPMRGPFDVIFCRNVIIYFDKPTQKILFERMAELQRPGDFLYLGHSESLHRVTDRYELIGRTIYRRVED